MKTIQVIEEKEGEGLISFLGKPLTLYCLNYIYTGTCIGVNDICIKLDAKDACIVYNTGELQANKFADAQKCGKDRYVLISAIESFEAGK